MFKNFVKENARQLKYTIQDLESELIDVKSERNDLAAKLRTVDRKHTEATEDKEFEQRKKDRALKQELAIKNERISELERQLETLDELIENETALETKAIELENREALLAAKEVNADNLAKHVKDAKAKGEEVAENRYQSGYADGLADGLRKAHEITAEDRRSGMQIAALAAASHQPDATKQIAQAIAKDVARALPSGKTRK